MATSIRGLVAFVTGASSGIGKAICIRFAQDGCDIFAVGRNEANLLETKEQCSVFGVRVETYGADVTDPAACVQAIEHCVKLFGGLNILVNSAGTAVLFHQGLDEWDQVIDVNLKAAMRLTKLALPHLQAQAAKKRRAAVLNIGSVSGVQSFGILSPYCASKHGLVGFSNGVFEQVHNLGIKVSIINPGWVDTPMLSGHGIEDPKMTPEQVAHTAHFVVTFPDDGCPTSITLLNQYS